MLLSRLAATSAAVAATSKRKEKTELLRDVIVDLTDDEITPAVGFLTGSARQGRIGVGWATVSRVSTTTAAEPSLTVADLDELLDRIAATTGPGSTEARSALLADFLEQATEDEVDFIRQILIGDLRQGALAGIVTDAVAKAAGVKAAELRRAVMLSGDLGQAANIALTAGADGLAEITLEVGRPIQPMLASTAPDVIDALGATGPASVEWKLDGARIQAHRSGADVWLYTRNLNDVTDRLPEVVELVRSFDCASAVLDGEVLGFFGEDPQAFQDTMSRFGTQDSVEELPRLRALFFDIMHLDGRSLIDDTLADRSRALGELVGHHRIPAVETDDPSEAAAHLDDALSNHHEGVMVKALTGPYEAGRRGKSWRKVKPVHTLDLVVLGAEWGHGRRRGWLSNLHLGARHPDSGEFVMVGKTFKGLTDELLTWQTERLLELQDRDEGHTVFIRPELVVEIALDGAQASTRYPGGVALRFARVRGYRPDRDPDSADTLDAVRALLPARLNARP